MIKLRLPDIDGLELQKRLTELQKTTPVIFTSEYNDVLASVQAMKRGAVDFLTKPFSESELLCAVAEAIERDRKNKVISAEIEILRARVNRLTPREHEVFREIVTGKLNKQIAATLGIAEKTVKVHRQRVMEKTQARSLAELVQLANRVPSVKSK